MSGFSPSPPRGKMKVAFTLAMVTAAVIFVGWLVSSTKRDSTPDSPPHRIPPATPSEGAKPASRETMVSAPVSTPAPEPPFPTTTPVVKTEALPGRKEVPAPIYRPLEKIPKQSTEEAVTKHGQKQVRLQELLEAAANGSDPEQAQADLNTAAGYYVGLNDWESARKIYQELAQSPFRAIADTARRNLIIADATLAMQAEPSPEAREVKLLELARLHFSFGHLQAARRFWRQLEHSAQESVRAEAAHSIAQTDDPAPPTGDSAAQPAPSHP